MNKQIKKGALKYIDSCSFYDFLKKQVNLGILLYQTPLKQQRTDTQTFVLMFNM